eukprot:COSAG01_NODE_1054_length_11906_cov_45.857796_3_plen_219_part_00
MEEGKKIIKDELVGMVARVMAEVNANAGAKMSTTLRASIGTMKTAGRTMREELEREFQAIEKERLQMKGLADLMQTEMDQMQTEMERVKSDADERHDEIMAQAMNAAAERDSVYERMLYLEEHAEGTIQLALLLQDELFQAEGEQSIAEAAAKIAKEKVSSLERELKTAGESEVQAQHNELRAIRECRAAEAKYAAMLQSKVWDRGKDTERTINPVGK